MKNLFVITEEEKNRILGLHESATKNQYLINEQYSETVIDKIKNPTLWDTFFGKNWKSYVSNDKTFGVKIDVSELIDIIVNITLSDDGNSGTFSFTYPNVSFADDTSDIKSRTGGTWSFSNGNFTGSIDGQSISKKSLQEVIYHLLKFFYPMSMQYYSRKSDLTTPQQDNSSQKTENSTWEQVVTKFPCLVNEKDKNIYNNGSYDYVKAKLDGVDFIVFIGDGHIYDPAKGKFTEIYLGKNYPCEPVVQTKQEPNVGQENPNVGQENPNVARIKELQRKVGVNDDGILGKQTLKAIMDKLTK